MSSDVYQPSSSNQSQPPPSALAVPSTSVEYGSSVALPQSVTPSPSTDMNSGSSTPIIRTSPSTSCSLLLQRLNKTVASKKNTEKNYLLQQQSLLVKSGLLLNTKRNKKWKIKEAEKDLRN
ncbi:hypothetical protein JTB14_031933 [Gonioctena quinquepunctata]|nr:hypothetical protein JTB14_031933 [Gonioctena quinquepunctata]